MWARLLARVASFFGLNIIRGRAWATIAGLVVIAFTAAYATGVVRTKLDCAADNARAEIKAERSYTDSVKEASGVATDSAVDSAIRSEYFRNAQREIQETYSGEIYIGSCDPIFNADDLRLFNAGSKIKDAESLRP